MSEGLSPAVALRWILRESRGGWGRVAYFAACLAVGVAAVVGTSALAASVDAGFREKAREILGADLEVDSRRPLPRELDAVIAARPGHERTDVVETSSMALVEDDAGRRSRLVQVMAVRGRYPLRGEIPTEPSGGLAAHLTPDMVVLSREAQQDLRAEVGSAVEIGGATFRVAAAALRAPPQFGFSALAGPRVWISADGFARTQLTGFGSRARHAVLVALPDAAGAAAVTDLERDVRALPGAAYLDVDTHVDAVPRGGGTARRIAGFVALAALLSLVVGGIGVAQVVHVWVAERTRGIATMRCLGVRPHEVAAVTLGHTLLLALAASAVGAAAGCAVPFVVGSAVPDLAPAGIVPVVPLAAVLRGTVLGTGVALVFALLPLTAVWRVPPALALRADAAPLPQNRAVAAAAALLLGASLVGAAAAQAERLDWALAFVGGFAALLAVLFAAARLLVAAARRLPRLALAAPLRHGVAALARPGAGAAAAIATVGLGTMVVTTVAVVQLRLREGLLAQVPGDAPSVFLLDVQPDQWEDVRGALAGGGATAIDHVPVIVARIAAIDGRPVEELAADGGEGPSRRWLTREQRLTTMRTLPESNRVVEGALWSDPAREELSLEAGFARNLGVGVGSRIAFDVQGVPVELTVTSLREVEWRSLSINFFLVVEPGVLERAPALLLASARVPPEREAALQFDVASRWPNVSVIRVGPLVGEVTSLLGRVVAGIAGIAAFTVAAGLLVVGGAAAAAAFRRRREVALLKVLGATRRDVALRIATEYALLGAVAGVVGSLGALALTAGFLHAVAEMPVDLPWLVVPVAAASAAAATALCGVVASGRALAVRPIESLR